MNIVELIPPDLTVLSTTGLVLLSFLTSALTAAVGIGGGLVFLAALASFLPPVVVLPVHGMVQFGSRSEEHTSELQSRTNLVCRLLLEKKKKIICLDF